MEKDERISNKTLGIFLFVIYIPIICFILFLIGLSKVDASNYFTIFNKDNVGQDLVRNYPNGGTYSYVGNIDFPSFGVINDSFNFEEGFVYRIRLNLSISYYVPSNFSQSCESFGRSAVLKINNRLGSNISTITRLWTMNTCSIVSYGNGWKYEFSYSYDATFEANSSIDSYDRISWYSDLNNPTISAGSFKVEFELSGLNIFNLGASDDKNTQDTINAINNSIQSLIDSIKDGNLKDDTPVDDSGLNDYKDKENGLVDDDALDNINNVDISLDTNTSKFFWDIFTRIINTHSLIYGLIISALSIGIIKLILNR